MGYIQVWESEGLGTDVTALCRVIGEFKTNGVQGITSLEALKTYIKRLNEEAIETMLQLDKEAALQILIDTKGAVAAFEQLRNTYKKEYDEVCDKYKERVTKVQAEKDNAESRLFKALRREDKLIERIEDLQFQILVLKAKLYDTYEAMNEPTDKNNIEGDMQPCRTKTGKTPSGSLE